MSEETYVPRLDGRVTAVNLWEIEYIDTAPPTVIDDENPEALLVFDLHRLYRHPEFHFHADIRVMNHFGKPFIEHIRTYEVPRADPPKIQPDIPVYSVAEMENDFLARLHRCERPRYKQIKLVEAMRGKSKETFEALTGPVHGDEAESSERTDNAWRKLANATTRSASLFIVIEEFPPMTMALPPLAEPDRCFTFNSS